MVEKKVGRVKLNFGSVGSLHINLEWRDDYGSDGPIGRTWGDLQLWIGDTLVWGELDSHGGTRGVTWNWIDFLEYLGNAWPYLNEEEQYPIIFDTRFDEPSHLGELWGRAKLRFRTLPDDVADQEDELLRDFLAVHDLSEAVQGISLPKLLCLRRGKQMVAATVRHEFVLSFDETIGTLAQLGNAIAERIVGLSDKRSENGASRWQKRDEISESKRLQIATGLDEAALRKVWPYDVNAANDNVYELKAAARMLGHRVSDVQLKTVLNAIGSLRSTGKLKLGSLANKALAIIREQEAEAPATQGYFLAWMLREHIGRKSGRVEPDEILHGWGVLVRELEIKESNLDAIAVWGPRHKPTIFLNSVGPRSQQEKGRRSTLAHEMCHILADLDGALPVADVLGGNMPRGIEKRANAFAAEFLLPRYEASTYIETALQFVYTQDERKATIERAISDLAEKYGASHETVAWQMLNSHVVKQNDQLVYEKKLKSVSDPFDTFAY
jgi:Zn-dependent peptidase ImmA (M78 family)